MSKVKIVLDADVIIHFSKGGLLSILPEIFPNYDYIILDKVYQEIKEPIKSQLDNQIHFLGKIKIVTYSPKGEEMVEFAKLSRDKGKGESACLAYCRYNQNVIGSSNLRDIQTYCKEHSIIYLSTLDFLYFAIKKGFINTTEADSFIHEVVNKDSRLPIIPMHTYVCKVNL